MILNGETGTISAVDGESIVVNFTRGDACDACGLKVVCAPGNQSQRRLTLPFSGEFKPGQQIQIRELSNLELHLALIQFGLPTLAFLVGLAFGYLFPQQLVAKELLAFLGASMGLGASFFAARSLVQRIVDVLPEKYLEVIACE